MLDHWVPVLCAVEFFGVRGGCDFVFGDHGFFGVGAPPEGDGWKGDVVGADGVEGRGADALVLGDGNTSVSESVKGFARQSESGAKGFLEAGLPFDLERDILRPGNGFGRGQA